MLGDRATGIQSRLSYGATVLVFTEILAGAYHVDYEQSREARLAQSKNSNVIISIPTVPSENSVASLVAHGAM